MATQTEAKALYDHLSEADASVNNAGLSKPKNGYDEEAHNIYQQAHTHRDTLIKFYTSYTICFSIVVAVLVVAQAYTRTIFMDSGFEIMPQWTLNLVITGMFVQFIGLLKIVTGSVWDLKSFFAHHSSMQPTPSSKKASEADE